MPCGGRPGGAKREAVPRAAISVHVWARAQAPDTELLSRMPSVAFYIAAAVGEIAGCFAFWAWLRLGTECVVDRARHRLAGGVRGVADQDRCGVRRPRLCRLWRGLHRGFAAVALADRGRAAGSLGPDRRQHLPGRRRRDPVRPAQRVSWVAALKALAATRPHRPWPARRRSRRS